MQRSSVVFLGLAAGIGLLPFSAWAQSPVDLDGVVVTATRTATELADTLAAVEVIDSEQIERSQATSLLALLQGRAGIQLANLGGPGKQTSLFLRGTDPDHVLVLIDGVRIGTTTASLAALQDIPIEQVEKIEIVRGPRSSLYGADAIGGVIHIFTRGVSGDAGLTTRLHAGHGSHDAWNGGAGFDLRGERGWMGADIATRHSDGIDACSVASPTPFSGGCFISQPQPDRDGYRNRSLSLRAGWRPSETFGIDARGLRSDGRNAYDGDFADRTDTLQQVVGVNARWAPSERWSWTLSAGHNRDLSDNFLGDAYMNRYDSTRSSVNLQADWTIRPRHTLTLGADWLRDAADVDDAFSAYSARRNNRALYGQYQARFGAHALQLGARHDHNAQFGGHATGQLAWGYALTDTLQLTASHGTAFKAPGFNDLYFPFFGNPDLEPETARSTELGLKQQQAHWHWQIGLYRTDIDDLIAYDATLGLPVNIEQARLRGAELVAGAHWRGWVLSSQISHVDARHHGGQHDRLWLPRRSRLSGRVDIDRSVGAWTLGMGWTGQGRRYDDLANTVRMGGYGTLDLRVEYAVATAWTVQAGITNLFDTHYETARFYRQPGREYALQLRYRARR